MPEFPIDFAYKRDWCVDSIHLAPRYAALARNWEESRDRINEIVAALAKVTLNPAVTTVAVAGSLGRMEASRDLSDGDLIIVLDDKTQLQDEPAQEAHASVWEALEPLGLEKPKPTGVFAQPTNIHELCGEAVGAGDEPLVAYGKRLLLLLESQPVYGDGAYQSLIQSIVARYAKDYVEKDPRKEWTFLLNDLIRYFRALCVNYQWDFDSAEDANKWPLRNVKLRHSRLVMYSGLLLLIGQASTVRAGKVKHLEDRLRLTPLERMAWTYEENHDWNFYRLAGLYNVFLSRLNEAEVRESLKKPAESYENRFEIPYYSELKANSDALASELMRFVFDRRGTWSERFFEYLLF